MQPPLPRRFVGISLLNGDSARCHAVPVVAGFFQANF